MGDLLVFRERRGPQEYVVATLPDGRTVWAMNRTSGEQWWYRPEYAEKSRAQISAAVARLEELPITDQRPDPAPVEAPPVPTPAVQPARCDLAAHRPGHAVLAEVHRLHGTAAPSAVDGLPGDLPPEIVSFSVGFVGEELVGQQLASLPSGWRALHAVPVGDRGSDLDHVLIGPPGVVVINTKHHRGATVDVKGDAVFLGGRLQRYVHHSRLEADRARAVIAQSGLPAPVTAVLCVVGGRVRVKERPQGVEALSAPDLLRWLTALPTALTTPEQVAALFDRLRWADAWTPHPPPPAAPDWVAELARQLATEHGVAQATRRSSSRTGRTPTTTAPRPTRRPPARRPANRPGRRRPARKASPRTTLLKLGVMAVLLLTANSWAGPLAAAVGHMAVSTTVRGQVTPTTGGTPTAPAGLLGYPAAPCTAGSGPAQDPLNRGLTCLPDGSRRTTWQLSDPLLRLPAAVPGAPCTTAGAHARSTTTTIQICATYGSPPQNRWTPDPTWTPS